MRLLDIYAPWAIVPDKLREIREIYGVHLRGEKIDYRAIEAKIPRPENIIAASYVVDNGVAIIDIQGPIAKGRGGIFSFLFGSTSTEEIQDAFTQALGDAQVFSIVLAIDSPGGTVAGTQELANTIYAARGVKPITAYTDGTMASAAYWIGSAADKVYISGDTNQVGSIGIYRVHYDESGMDGSKATEIYSGKYKAMGSPVGPLTDEARQYLQAQADYLYSVFVGDVARNRGASVETVLSDMADGRIFLGRQALEAGLVDGVSTLDGIVKSLSPSRVDMLRASIQARINQIQA